MDYLNSYKLVKELGRGGFGITYLYQKGKDQVAVKVVKTQHYKKNELEILKLLQDGCSQNNVLCFKDFFKGCEETVYVTDYIPGKNMFEWSAKVPRLDFEDVKMVVLDFIKAVNYIHSKGVFHADIKPDNVMMHGNIPIIIDFGCSTLLKDSKIIAHCGTPSYSPDDRFFLKNLSREEAVNYDLSSLVLSIEEILDNLVTTRSIGPKIASRVRKMPKYRAITKKLVDGGFLDPSDLGDQTKLNKTTSPVKNIQKVMKELAITKN